MLFIIHRSSPKVINCNRHAVIIFSVEFNLSRTKTEDLKPFHRLLFSRAGMVSMFILGRYHRTFVGFIMPLVNRFKVHEIKKNIKKFSGFTFASDSSDYQRKRSVVEKYVFVGDIVSRFAERSLNINFLIAGCR